MSLFDKIFRTSQPKNSASIAKERLNIIVAHERISKNSETDFFPKLQQELLDVIARYFDIDKEQVNVELEKHGNSSLLELNITLPDHPIEVKAEKKDVEKKEEVTEES